MKKLFLVAGLIATTANAGSTFTGGYAGLKFDRAWTKFTFADTTSSVSKDSNISGFEADLFGGYGFTVADGWIAGVEGHIGHGFAEKKTSFKDTIDVQGKNRRLWKFGVAPRVGYVFNNNVLVYGRVGLHLNQYQYRVTATRQNAVKGNFMSWEVAPGLGVEYSFNSSVNARFEYVYEYGMNTKGFTFAGRQLQINRPKTNVLSLGVSFAL